MMRFYPFTASDGYLLIDPPAETQNFEQSALATALFAYEKVDSTEFDHSSVNDWTDILYLYGCHE